MKTDIGIWLLVCALFIIGSPLSAQCSRSSGMSRSAAGSTRPLSARGSFQGIPSSNLGQFAPLGASALGQNMAIARQYQQYQMAQNQLAMQYQQLRLMQRQLANQQAEPEFESVASQPESETNSPKAARIARNAQRLFEQAKALTEKGETDKANRIYRRIIRMAPDSNEAQRSIAVMDQPEWNQSVSGL